MADKNDAREWLEQRAKEPGWDVGRLAAQLLEGWEDEEKPRHIPGVNLLTAYAAAVTQERDALRPNDDELECIAIEVEKKGASDPQILHIGIFCALRDLRDKLYTRAAAEESHPSEPRPEIDPIKELCELIRESGVKVCFCTVCSHQPTFGHCFFCHCGNSLPQPEIADENGMKMLATIARLKQLLKNNATQEKIYDPGYISHPPED